MRLIGTLLYVALGLPFLLFTAAYLLDRQISLTDSDKWPVGISAVIGLLFLTRATWVFFSRK